MTVTTRPCSDLDTELNSLLADGYRLDMIMPADHPREAIVSKGENRIHLMSEPPAVTGGLSNRIEYGAGSGDDLQPLANAGRSDWVTGRAGMEYRDLIPGRLDGLLIASHIRITTGGEVPDYVHYHKIRFQMIYCKSGRVRVVYEDQGPPFWLEAGDCVLQPPEIRHRVLEASGGAEVVEVSSPAEHETWIDHDLHLPTTAMDREPVFSAQRFVHHVAADARLVTEANGNELRDTGIGEATRSLADVRVVRCLSQNRWAVDTPRTMFFFVLRGRLTVVAAAQGFELDADQGCVLHAGAKYEIAGHHAEFLQVTFADSLIM